MISVSATQSRIYPSRMPSRRQVARHRIRASLRQRILNGEWKPGTKLKQARLAKDFGVSMGLVREALLELQGWGLVETIDNRGIFVREFNAQRLLEAYEVREVLEGLAARRCCGRIPTEQLSELEAMAERMLELAESGKGIEAGQLDREFHERLIAAADSEMLSRLADNYRFVGKVVWFKTDPQRTRDGHVELLHAIRDNRPDDAERLAKENVLVARREIERQLSEGSFEPHWLT